MRLRRFSLDLSKPLETASGAIREREGFLVAVRGSNGTEPGLGDDGDHDAASAARETVWGVGEATPLPGWTESLTSCESTLEAALEPDSQSAAGRPEPTALDPASSPERGYSAVDAGGIDPADAPAARHGFALARDAAAARDAGHALADRLAERVGFPTSAESVPVNATVGDAPRDETVAAAERAVADGFDCLKVKVGARSLDADVERLCAVRDAVGSEITLRADVNGAWDRATAARALTRLEPFDIAYVEQPLPAEDLAGTARLSGDSSVPIALDESLTAASVETVLAAEAADVVVLKPMALGGPDRAVAAAKRARERGVEPVVTTTVDAVVARTAAVHVAAAIPDVPACGLATGALLAADLGPDPCSVSDGQVSVPAGPGLAGDAFDDLVPSGAESE